MDNKAVNTDHHMENVNILNVLKLNIYQMLICMFCTHCIKKGVSIKELHFLCSDCGQRTISTVYQSRYKRVTHPYLTRFCKINFSEKSQSIKLFNSAEKCASLEQNIKD